MGAEDFLPASPKAKVGFAEPDSSEGVEDFLPASPKGKVGFAEPDSSEGVEDFLPASPKGKVGFAEPDSPEPERRVIKRDSNFTKSVNKSMMGKSIIQTALDAFEGGEESVSI